MRWLVVFVLGSTAVVMSILRLSGTVTWPGRGWAIAALAVLLAPIAVVLVAVVHDVDKDAENSRFGRITSFFPWE